MEIKGNNILVISMLSTRDKESGLYNVMQDGNISSMLNKLFININNFETCILTLPPLNKINIDQYRDLYDLIGNKFEYKILLYHTDLYSSSVASTRKSMMRGKQILDDIKKQSFEIDTIISEFPINFGIGRHQVIYNYNWNKVSDDDNSPSAQYFNEELRLAKYFKTYLFSDIQYEYMNSKQLGLKIIRSKHIYSPELLQYFSDFEISKLSNKIKNEVDKILENTILFYPLRVEDPRYKYDKCYEYAKENNLKFVTTNHTNVETKYDEVIDIRRLFPEHLNRPIYYYILSKLTENDVILRHEYDMHVSLIEQTILSKANIITPNFTNGQINKYIYDGQSVLTPRIL